MSDNGNFRMTEVDTRDSIMVSIQDGVLCAATASIDQMPKFWWVSRVFVRKKYRRQGLGKRCLQRAIELVKSHEGTPRNIVVAPGGYDMDTRRQEMFYEAQGFKRAKEGHFELKVDMLERQIE